MKPKEQAILDAALLAWGQNKCKSTSLSDISSHLNFTKQAIYRYFSSKEELEEAIEQASIRKYQEHIESLSEQLSHLEGEQFGKAYFEAKQDFLRKNHLAISFLIYRYSSKDTFLQKFQYPLHQVFKLAMDRAGIPEVGIRFINAFAVFTVHRMCLKQYDETSWNVIWQKGFVLKNEQAPNFQQIQRDGSLLNFRIFQDKPLLKAVFDAVVEGIGEDVSLEKIARKAGISKSSLYNYWASKEVMLKDVFEQSKSHLLQLFENFSQCYKRKNDIYFAYLVFIANLLSQDNVYTYIQRMVLSGIHSPKEIGAIMGDALSSLFKEPCFVKPHHYTPEEFIGLTNISTVNEIRYHLASESERSHTNKCLKELYLILEGGISKLRSTTL